MPINQSLQNISEEDIVLFSLLIIGVFFAFFAIAIVSYRLQNQKMPLSPYSGMPLRNGADVPLSNVEKIMKFLYYGHHSYDNRVFPMKKALVCRETGRIFPYAISWWGFHHIDWTFLSKRYPGVYTSWGSLTREQKEEIRALHNSLEGFQTEESSPEPSPRKIAHKYSFLKPGPLYVDLDTKVLLGWKCVPETMFEVLIVQKPKQSEKEPVDRILAKKNNTKKERK